MKPFHNCSELRCLCLCAFHSGQLQASKIAFLSAFICCETGAFILMHIQKRAADMTWIILNVAWKGGAGLEVEFKRACRGGSSSCTEAKAT